MPRFVEIARSRFPGMPFRVAERDDLGVPDRSVAGILSWYSIIHTDPDDVPRVLGEFARCLGDGGSLLLGMFEGPKVEPFAHAVTTAYFWSIEEMSRQLRDSGFRVEARESRADRHYALCLGGVRSAIFCVGGRWFTVAEPERGGHHDSHDSDDRASGGSASAVHGA